MLRQLVLGLVVLVLGSAVFVSSGVAARDLPLAIEAPEHLIAGRSIGQLTHMGLQDPLFAERVRHYLAEHGVNHPEKLDLGDRTPLEAARETLNVELRNGRTIAQWVGLADAASLLAREPSTTVPGDLALDTLRLARLAGVTVTAADRLSVQAQAEAMPAALRQPFADLVHVTADVYEAQLPIAARLAVRLEGAQDAMDIMLSDADREATLAGALALLAAENAFRANVAGLDFPAAATPIFRDPAGLVILGSTGNDVYERTGTLRDPILLADLGGDDIYFTTAAGACPETLDVIADCNGLAVSTLLDLAGDDVYTYNGKDAFTQGAAGMGAIGVLVDVEGNDFYYSLFDRDLNNRGPIFMYVNGGAQGYALAGVGLLIDGLGNDVYEADVQARNYDVWGFSQGFGNAGGIGISADGAGDDSWLAYGFDDGMPVNSSFQGLYPGGTGFYGGLGVMSDTGAGNDEYHAWDNATTTDFYAYGFAAFGGTGIFFEDGGDDDYQAVESATDPWIKPLLNCAFGTASFAGLGVFLEMGGNDHYFGDTRAPHAVATMNEGFGGPAEGEGIFLDLSGDDRHFMEAHLGGVSQPLSTHGRGLALGGGEGLTGNTFGLYLDLGGADQYTGAAPSRDNAAWPSGMDFNAGQIPSIFRGNER